MVKNNLAGERFGRVLVLTELPERVSAKVRWNCICDCGKSFDTVGSSLISGNTKSCGCWNVEVARSNMSGLKHGMSKTKTYKSWDGMRARCGVTGTKPSPRYGGRGITVCDRWTTSFETFLADMGECPPKMTLERLDYNKGYYPENCCWASIVTQANNKSSNHLITVLGETKNVTQFAKQYGIPAGKVFNRLWHGWTAEQAVGVTKWVKL